MDPKEMGLRIAAARRAKGFTQKQLAQRLAVTDKAVSKWERGSNYPDIELLGPLAAELGVSALHLLGGEGMQAEQAVQLAAQISAREKQGLKRGIRINALFTLAVALALAGALVYVSYVLSQAGLYGMPQGLSVGLLPLCGWLAGSSLYLLRHLKKL